MGMLSRRHPDDAAGPWRGPWQTDAAAFDSNAGGAAVDLEGRLLGLFTLWYPARHGRSSGVAFVVPWARILAALPDLPRGARSRRRLPRREVRGGARAAAGGGAAGHRGRARAGLRAGDLIRRIDREVTDAVEDVVVVLGFRCGGEPSTSRSSGTGRSRRSPYGWATARAHASARVDRPGLPGLASALHATPPLPGPRRGRPGAVRRRAGATSRTARCRRTWRRRSRPCGPCRTTSSSTCETIRRLTVSVYNLQIPRKNGKPVEGEPPRPVGGGSGVLVERKRRIWVITNVHVVQGADAVQVVTSDGKYREWRCTTRSASTTSRCSRSPSSRATSRATPSTRPRSRRAAICRRVRG